MARRRLRTILTATTLATGMVAVPVAANPLTDLVSDTTDELVSTVDETTGGATDPLTDTVEEAVDTVTETVDSVLDPVTDVVAPDDDSEDGETGEDPVLGSIGDTVEKILNPDQDNDKPSADEGDDDTAGSGTSVTRPVGGTTAAGSPVQPAEEPAPPAAEPAEDEQAEAPAPRAPRAPAAYRQLQRDVAPAPPTVDQETVATPRIAPPVLTEPQLDTPDDRAVMAVDPAPDPFRDPYSPLKVLAVAMVAGTAVVWRRMYTARVPEKG